MRKRLIILIYFYVIFLVSCKEEERKSLFYDSYVNLCLNCHKKKNVKSCVNADGNMSSTDCLNCHKGDENHYGFSIKKFP